MGRTGRLRQIVEDYLVEIGPANTHEIFQHVNDRLRHGCVMNQLSNVLARDMRFEKTGMQRIDTAYGRHNVCIWRLRDD